MMPRKKDHFSVFFFMVLAAVLGAMLNSKKYGDLIKYKLLSLSPRYKPGQCLIENIELSSLHKSPEELEILNPDYNFIYLYEILSKNHGFYKVMLYKMTPLPPYYKIEKNGMETVIVFSSINGYSRVDCHSLELKEL